MSLQHIKIFRSLHWSINLCKQVCVYVPHFYSHARATWKSANGWLWAGHIINLMLLGHELYLMFHNFN